ncbi:hypothetical protein BDB01DRAFT_837464 [Pilobolus umbonatus]|nr:hypothetical protein BDB01DRAFT_837464 [Pilobolus umbonatus]
MTLRAFKHSRRHKFNHSYALTPEDAVYNIVSNHPQPDRETEHRHILNCLVENEPGVLSRMSGIIASRNFNIDSLVVAMTEVPKLSRTTIVLKGDNVRVEQARRQLEDMVHVWAVLDYTKTKIIERELLLIKVSILGPDHLHEQLPTFKLNENMKFDDDILNNEIASVEAISPSTELRQTFDHLRALSELCKLFEGKILDVASDSIIIELCAKPERISTFMKLCKPFGILEAARTGMMVMPRAPVQDHYGAQVQHSYEKEEEDEPVDPTTLPPG